MDFIRDTVAEQATALRGLWKNKRQLSISVLNLAMIVFSALMMWKGLMVVTRSESPVVVVLSGSMEPAFYRGDILVLDNNPRHMEVGDIVVFKITGRDVPIVHRILRRHARGTLDAHSNTSGSLLPPWGPLAPEVEVDYLTKGDNNNIDDRNLYATGQLWLSRKEIVGRSVAFCPHIGMVTILLNDYPALKYALVGIMGLFVLTGKEA